MNAARTHVATLNDGRQHILLKIERLLDVDGHRCIVGVWANGRGVTRALVRVATVSDWEMAS